MIYVHPYLNLSYSFQLKMFLKELHLFQPKQYGYFLHSQPLAFAAHPSSNYLAFSSR